MVTTNDIFLEILPNLKSLSILIPADVCNFKKLSIEPERLQLDHQSFKLPVKVNPSSLIRQSSQGCIHLKLSIVSDLPPRISDSDLLLDAHSLSGLVSIQCKSCASTLNTGPSFKRLANTPSEYWYELMDCWACHKEDYSGIQGQRGGVVYAQKDALLVASYYVILHKDNLSPGSITKDLNKVS